MLLLHRRQTPPRSQGSFLIQGEKAPSHNWDRFHNSGSVPPRGLHFLEAAVSSSLVENGVIPRDAQRAALSAKAASQARSMLALLTDKGSEIALPSGSRRVRKDAFKPDSC